MKQKNELATLTPKQSNPYTAVPEDFQVGRADEFSDGYVPGHGQCGKDEKEYNELLKAADAPGINKSRFGEPRRRPVEASNAGRPHAPSGRDEE